MSAATPTIKERDILARTYIETNSQTEAFRAAFPKSKANPSNLNKQAHRVFKQSDIKARVSELRASVIAAAEAEAKKAEKPFHISFEQKKKMLTGLYNDAKKAGKQTAAIAALRELNLMDGDHAATRMLIGGDKASPPIRLSLGDFYDMSEAEAAAQKD